MEICQGSNTSSTASIETPYVRCGFLTPPAKSSNNVTSDISDNYLTQDIHVCASGIRAGIRETTFKYKRGSTIPTVTDLEVPEAKPKVYNNSTDKPFWGIENTGKSWKLADIQLIWGLVDKARSSAWNIRTIQSEYLYLPAFINTPHSSSASVIGFGDSMVSILSFSAILGFSLIAQ